MKRFETVYLVNLAKGVKHVNEHIQRLQNVCGNLMHSVKIG